MLGLFPLVRTQKKGCNVYKNITESIEGLKRWKLERLADFK